MELLLSLISLAAAPAPQDFNGDGSSDLAIGAPGESINGAAAAGAVTVLYGSPAGIQLTGGIQFHQDSPGIMGGVTAEDHFGAALAWGDFDGDGYDDLAIGVPGTSVNGKVDAGAVAVLYGSVSGLNGNGDQLLYLDLADAAGDSHADDRYGSVLAAGDFNADGRQDLTVGMPGSAVSGHLSAGQVHVMYGSPAGLRLTDDLLWSQSAAGAGQIVEPQDLFGAALVAGRFNFDAYLDLAIGVPGEGIGSLSSAGMVEVTYGSATGLDASTTEVWHQNSPGIAGSAEAGDRFGTALAAGDFNADLIDDLVLTVPLESVGSLLYTGGVNVIYGSAAGLSAAGNQFLRQGSGLPGLGETGDYTGYSAVVAGDFNGDGWDDAAIGAPEESIGNAASCGAVLMSYGGPGGLGGGGGSVLNQGMPGTASAAESADYFGHSLGAGDFDGDGAKEVVVGATLENIGAANNCGSVEVFYGLPGLSGYQIFHQGPGVPDANETGDFFGHGLAR